MGERNKMKTRNVKKIALRGKENDKQTHAQVATPPYNARSFVVISQWKSNQFFYILFYFPLEKLDVLETQGEKNWLQQTVVILTK